MNELHLHEQTVPVGARWLIAGLVGTTLLAATAVRLGFAPVAASPVALRAAEKLSPISTRNLSFVDRADGGLVVTDVGTGRVVKTYVPGEPSGFVRGMMRGMARERRMHNVGPAAPFLLEAWPDGELSLSDKGTGRSIELSAFGPTNRAAFAALLK